MNFKREKTKELYLKDTPIENLFIAEYMADADGDCLKVYLTALMYADTNEMSNSLIARCLGITEEEVLNAWNYWENKGVIRKLFTDPHDRFHYTVEFLNLKEHLYGASKDSGDSQDKISEAGLMPDMDDDMLRELIASLEDISGRLMEGRETETVVSWLYEDRLEPDLIKFAYKYCTEKRGNNRFTYISAVLREWMKSGVYTYEAAEKYLDDTELRRNQYKRIMQALGFYRSPTEAEQAMIDKWFDEMGFDMEKVLDACSRTTGIGNPNFNYLNGILSNWYATANGGGSAADRPTASRSKGARNAVSLVNKLYDEIRKKNESIRAERKKAVFSTIPRIEEIEIDMRRTSMELSKAAFNGGRSGGISADALKNRLKELENEKTHLLTENGFPSDYLELQYECKSCRDTGILDNGERCKCFSEKLKQFV